MFFVCVCGGNVAISWPDRGSGTAGILAFPRQVLLTINHCLFLSNNYGPVWKNGAPQLERLISCCSSGRGPLGSVKKVVLALQSGVGSG